MGDDTQSTQALDLPKLYQAGDLIAGRFEIIRCVGQGAHGIVYLVLDQQLNVTIALKLIHELLSQDPAFLARLRQELLISRKITHPNVVRVHDFYQTAEMTFYTMDYIEGASLLEFTKQNTDMTLEQWTLLIESLLEGVEACHQQDIFHCDIKPENIIVSSSCQSHLLDFGVAAAKGEINRFATPSYCAPEYQSTGKVTAVADLYAVGISLYEACFYQSPFNSQNAQDLLIEKQSWTLCEDRQEAAGQIQKVLYRFIQRLTSKPLSRPQDAAAAKELWQELVAQQSTSQWFNTTPKKAAIALGAITGLIVLGYLAYERVWTHDDKSVDVQESVLDKKKALDKKTALDKEALKPRSIAILPAVDRTQNDQDNHILQAIDPAINTQVTNSSSFSALSQYALTSLIANYPVRVIDNRRLDDMLNYLDYTQPLNIRQLQSLAELLAVDFIVSATYIEDQDNLHLEYQLHSFAQAKHTSQVIDTNLVKREGLSAWMTQLSGEIVSRIAISSSYKEQPEQYPDLLIDFANVKSLFQQGKTNAAKNALKNLLGVNPKYVKGIILSAKIAFYEQNWLDLESLIRQVKPLIAANSLASYEVDILQALSRNQFERASEIYQKLLDQAPYLTEQRFDYANLLMANNELDLAKSELLSLVDVDAQNADAWFAIGKISIRTGDIQRALDDYLVKALIINKKLKNLFGEGQVLNAFGVALLRLGKLEQAEDYFQQALDIRQKVKDDHGVATTLANFAIIHSIRGEFDSAEQFLQRSLSSWKKLDDAVGMSNTLEKLGLLEEERGNLDLTLDYYRQSLSLRMPLGDNWLKAESMNNVGYAYFLLSDIEHALTYLQQAEQEFLALNEPMGIIKVRQILAQIYLQQGKWSQARQLFTTTIQDAKTLGLEEEIDVANAYLARLSFNQGKFDEVKLTWQKALDRVTQNQDQRGIIEFTNWLIELYLVTGELEQAKVLFQSIEPLISERHINEQVISYQWLKIKLAMFENQFARAEQIALSIEKQNENKLTPITRIRLQIYQIRSQLVQGKKPVMPTKTQWQQFKSVYAVESLQLIEAMLHHYQLERDWAQVASLLNEALPLLSQMTLYWRRYQFDAIAYQMKKSKRIKSADPSIYQSEFNRVLKHIAPDLEAEFKRLHQLDSEKLSISIGF
jgi:eukaryotic-like serine/threonine-protein kinase